MTQVISINNNKGGVLKSTTALAVAGVLAKKYLKKVLIIDTDTQSNIATAFGLSNSAINITLYDLLFLKTINPLEIDELVRNAIVDEVYKSINDSASEKEKEIKATKRKLNILKKNKLNSEIDVKEQEILEQEMKILQKEHDIILLDDNYGSISIIAASKSLDQLEKNLQLINFEYASKNIKIIIDTIKKANDYDYIIIDTPPTISLLEFNLLKEVNIVIIPLEMEYYAIKGLTKILAIIDKVKEENKDIVIGAILPTKVRYRSKLHNEVYKILSKSINNRDDGINLLPLENGIPVSVKEASAIAYKSRPYVLTKSFTNLKKNDKVILSYIELVDSLVK